MRNKSEMNELFFSKISDHATKPHRERSCLTKSLYEHFTMYPVIFVYFQREL